MDFEKSERRLILFVLYRLEESKNNAVKEAHYMKGRAHGFRIHAMCNFSLVPMLLRGNARLGRSSVLLA